MLGKLYINANSEAEKLQNTTDLVASVIDDKLSSDASSRNALSKLHVMLRKAMGEAKTMRKPPDDALAPAVDDGLAAVDDHEVDASVSPNEEDIKVEEIDDENVTKANDSLLEDLLDDEEHL